MSGCPIGPILGSLDLALGGGKGGEGLDPNRNPVGVSIPFFNMPPDPFKVVLPCDSV